jgi:hypothetical protein
MSWMPIIALAIGCWNASRRLRGGLPQTSLARVPPLNATAEALLKDAFTYRPARR